MPLDRRRLLTSLLVLAHGARRAWGQKSDPDTRPNLGFSLYGMPQLELDRALRICTSVGYDHVELCLNPGYPTHPEVFRPERRRDTVALLSELRLRVSALMVLLNLAANDEAHQQGLAVLAAAARVAHDLDNQNPPLIETVLGGTPTQWDAIKNRLAARLADWARVAEEQRVIVGLKAHVSSAVNTPDRLLWLLEQVPSRALQVVYDYSHFELQGIDLAESLKSLLPRTRLIHVKDTRGDAREFQFLLPGEGRTDYRLYFDLLRQHSYAGPVCVEVSGQVFGKPGYDPIAAARRSHAALSRGVSGGGNP
jgi:inosose dehydratase